MESSLIALDEAGWILAPQESLEDLLWRKSIIEQKKEQGKSLGRRQERTWEVFRFRLESIPMIVCSKRMAFLEAASLWVYGEGKERYPVIHMRKKCPSWICEEEVLAHELVHAARIGFQSIFFEEILAYQTSFSAWRRWGGPCLLFAWEGYVLLALSWISVSWALGFAGYLGVRLLVLQALFFLAKRKLCKQGLDPLPCLLRLADREIGGLALVPWDRWKQKVSADRLSMVTRFRKKEA